MDDFVRHLPKAELHLHIEGTLEPELMFELAQRNGVPLPFASPQEARASYVFHDLQSFLDLYYRGCSVLVTEADFYDLTWAYLERVASEGVRHAEIFFDPQSHTSRGVEMGTVVSGISRALNQASESLGISSQLIMCFLRHLSADEAMATLDAARPHLSAINGVGLDSAEVGNPPGRFAEVFAQAADLGLFAVAHAGEEGPASYITEALDTLGVLRIDHGVRCLDDPAVVDRLVRDQVPLTVCPLSNVKLGVFSSVADHNIAELVAQGVVVTVNSDDPAYFGGYVGANYQALSDELGFTHEQLVDLARSSFIAAVLDDATRQRYLDELDAYAAQH